VKSAKNAPRPRRAAHDGGQGSALASAGATRVLQVALRDDCSLQDLGELVRGDPVFALRTLQWANSSTFRRARAVTDIGQAISLIGVRGLRNLALGVVVTSMVPHHVDAHRLLAVGLRRALAARAVAARAEPTLADTAFTAGLFLETGIMAQGQVDLTQALTVATSPAHHRPLRERALGLAPHPEVGARLAAEHHLPEALVQAILHHHDPEPPPEALARIAWAAEQVAGLFEAPDVAEAEARAARALRTLGLGREDLQAIAHQLPEAVTEAGRIFEREVGPQLSCSALLLDANHQLMEANLQYEAVVQALEAALAEKERLARALEEANARLQTLADTDPLTGLPNRRVLEVTLERELARAARSGGPVLLAVADIDRFKAVNDAFGHEVGDEVLAAVAKTLAATFRASDLVARFGGEEFVILAPDCPPEQATAVLEGARRAVEGLQIAALPPGARVSISIGADTAVGAACLGAAPALFRRADEALYRAKAEGRNQVRVAQPA
jgi:two-component system cell cycle response regulator